MRSASFIFFFVLLLVVPQAAFAATAAELQAQIDANNARVTALQKEIAEYQKELDVLGAKKSTLQSTVNSLTLSQKQLSTQIQITQSKIASANLKIQELTLSIGDKEETIAADQDAIAKAFRSVAQDEQTPLIAELISSRTLSEAWRSVDEATQFNRALQVDIESLRTARKELSDNRNQVIAVKSDLVALQNDLTLQKRSVDATKATQQKLLSDTRNQESSYQALLSQKKTAEKAFEQELVDLQNQLNLIVHPGLLPKVGSGVLAWPFSASFMNNCMQRKPVFGNLYCITQYFGNTPFSTANPQVYSGHGHNAIDIGAPIGTPVVAALSGVVSGAGNTDLARGCYSFGKWVMIQHYNGLSTLYAHLSVSDVSVGQKISVGQVIGLSGMTGYATGPHLHFGVYATEGTKITTLGSMRGSTGACSNALMPVASLDAYLNPLSYL